MSKVDDTQAGVINPDELYTLQAFKKRLGIADATVRSARRAGLRVTYLHRQGYVFGRDWIDYVLKSQDGRMGDTTADAG